jgi:hypothetical protein
MFKGTLEPLLQPGPAFGGRPFRLSGTYPIPCRVCTDNARLALWWAVECPRP